VDRGSRPGNVMNERVVLIASADRLYGEAASARIEAEPAWRVADTVADGLHALAAMTRIQPQALLVIGQLPRLGPAALARQVTRRWPKVTAVLVGGATSDEAVCLGPHERAEQVLRALAGPPAGRGHERAGSKPAEVALLATLTPRERTVLKLLSSGQDMAQIAGAMRVSEHTVRTHIQNVYSKLGVHSRLDVIRFAAKHGLVKIEDRARSF
jgi:DNA-binding NarL/FixJ family response regulator